MRRARSLNHSEMLWVCLSFPCLALEAFDPEPETPFVIERCERNRREVMLASPAAQKAGVKMGMSIAKSYNACDHLQVRSRDNALEEELLQRIALLIYQFGPHLRVVAPHHIVMEIESSLSLLGGCDAFMQCLTETLKNERVSYVIAGYPTEKGAIALARSAASLNSARVFPLEAINACPLYASALDVALVAQMQGMGLQTLGDLFALPSAALGKRFGKGVLLYLQELRGLKPSVRPLFELPERFSYPLELGHEAINQQALLFPLKRLLKMLEHYLYARQLLAASIVLLLKRRDTNEDSIIVTPTQGAYKSDELLSLFRLRLEHQTLSQPVLEMRLKCSDFLPWKPIANDLFDVRAGLQLAPQALADRLQLRLGADQVLGMHSIDDHRPDRAWHTTMFGLRGEKAHTLHSRPIWLLERPRALVNEKGMPCDGTALQMLQGPERIDVGWWDQASESRDYFLARHPDGALLWVFRSVEQPDQWYVHGFFS